MNKQDGKGQNKTIVQLSARNLIAIADQQKGFESKIAHQQAQIEALTAGLQTLSAQVGMSRPASQMVLNNQ